MQWYAKLGQAAQNYPMGCDINFMWYSPLRQYPNEYISGNIQKILLSSTTINWDVCDIIVPWYTQISFQIEEGPLHNIFVLQVLFSQVASNGVFFFNDNFLIPECGVSFNLTRSPSRVLI